MTNERHSDIRTRLRGPSAPQEGPEPLPPLVAVVGPTASGKTGLAIEIAERFGGEIVNTDAMQVYRGFDIGTAKAGEEERSRVAHHLLDVVDPDETYSAGAYVRDARRVIADLEHRGRLPVLCGGTGLYFRALLQGLAEIPPIPEPLRREVQALLAERGAAACHAELALLDPEAAAEVHPNDPARIARALEVFRATGRPIGWFRRQRPYLGHTPGVLSVGFGWPRATLYERIARRTHAMLARGWVDEVRALLARGYDARLKPFRSIGYREIVESLSGQRDAETLPDAIATRTRQYAKRQLTWFRKHPAIVWAAPDETRKLLDAIARFLQGEAQRSR